ncbi:MAG: hypothetical protein KDB68_06430 [Planctomycetes bacterium]|nr:hypothetical protein [Planctomycetota bacterium]
MTNAGSIFKRLSFLSVIALAVVASACDSSDSSGGDAPSAPVTFTSTNLPTTTANAGDVLELGISGGDASIAAGFCVRFTVGANEVNVPPMHVGRGKAFVMVPPMSTTTAQVADISIVDMNGNVTDQSADSLTVAAYAGTQKYTDASFDAALGQGLGKLVNLAVEGIDTLEAQGYYPGAEATVARDALNQQIAILNTISIYNDNLSASEMAMLQNMLSGTGYLEFLAQVGGVSLTTTGSQTSAQSNVLVTLVESALLKADFASFLIGEVRGALAIIYWVANQMSSWPIVGNGATNVAAWAQGLSASLKPAADLINQMIPSDLVTITPNASVNVPLGGSASVQATGRFETEEAFNQQLFTQTVTTYVNQAANVFAQFVAKNNMLAPYSSYIQQAAALVPGWINNWLTQNGYIGASVVPGSNYTVFAIPALNLDMSQYRLDVAGIVANLINIPYNAVNAFFSWVGINVGQPVGGFDGVEVSGVATYLPNIDSLQGVSTGNTQAAFEAPLCRPSTSWWGQWGFYSLKTNKEYFNVSVN